MRYIAPERLGLFYVVVRGLVRHVLARWLRLNTRGEQHLDIDGGVIVAPVHRSNLDAPLVAAVSRRRIRALGKESLFRPAAWAWVNAALGAIPVRRGVADREAVRTAVEVISSGEMMIVFPEGMRQTGRTVDGTFDGTVYLANKTSAPIIPIGIAGTEAAMASGSRSIKRVRCAMVIGAPIRVPQHRLSRPEMAEFGNKITAALQSVFDEAHTLVSG